MRWRRASAARSNSHARSSRARAGLVQKPSPGRGKCLPAFIEVIGASAGPFRHRHRDRDVPLPCGFSPPDAADRVSLVAEDVVVVDTGPGGAGIEGDRFGHGDTGREGTQARRYRKVEPAQVPRDKGWIAVPQLRRSASPISVWQRGPKRVVSLGIGNARIDKSFFATCGHMAPLRWSGWLGNGLENVWLR